MTPAGDPARQEAIGVAVHIRDYLSNNWQSVPIGLAERMRSIAAELRMFGDSTPSPLLCLHHSPDCSDGRTLICLLPINHPGEHGYLSW
jgi:hypothetical protein